MSQPHPDGPKGRACVVCGKPQDARVRPFCSKRCAEIDLGRWLKAGYAIAGREGEEEDGLPAAAGPEGDGEA